MNKKVGRNDPCPCGSGKKYKQCCWKKDQGKMKFSARKMGPGSGSSIGSAFSQVSTTMENLKDRIKKGEPKKK